MDEQPPKCSSAISVESDSSECSMRSLGPIVPTPSKSSQSMVEVMSLERSDYSGELMKRILGPIESRNKELDYLMRQGVRSDESRESMEEENGKIAHVCVCTTSCEHEKCPCLYYENEECSPYYCCPKCIEAKAQPKEQPVKGRGSVEVKISKTSCMCFKTKCLKKYCTCFAAGEKCGRKCKCEECENWEIDFPKSREPYLESESNQRQMPAVMEFQPVDLNISD